eukprot:TRINITY_DN7660_c0_g1_i6.p1 TRINITY_DN7660_c0_g1~~TRINITY_DN7660_c0_g1_i6.p1  ORF type:complete len:653 (+),score=91.69 TRINITY_DN7660_c0_g1_i6:30-1988(+)
MPRPTNSSNGFAGSVETLDAVKSFETHVNGIVLAFQLLQQQYHELLQGDASGKADLRLPLGSFSWPNCEAAHAAASDEQASALLMPSVTTGPSVNCMPQSPMNTEQGSIAECEEQLELDEVSWKQLQSQFQRLDKSSTGILELPEIKNMMNSFIDNWELENLTELVAHLAKLAEADAVQAPRHTTYRGSSVHSDGITFGMFVVLVSSEKLRHPPTPSSIRRDAQQLREGFEKENECALYADDGHLGEQGYPRVPTGYEALLLDILPAIVIILNAVSIGLSSDIETESVWWQVFEYVFMAFYLFECAYKIWLYGWGWYFTGPDWKWNVFDCTCLIISLLDAVLSTVLMAVSDVSLVDLDGFMLLKVVRISRLFRIVRTLHYEVFDELKTMVLGVISGMRCLLWAMVLLFILIYISGIAAKQLLGSREPEFETVPAAMFTLFRCFTEGCVAYDGTPLTERLRHKYGSMFLAPYLILFMGISLGVFNLVTAVFIDNVMVSQLLRKLHEISNTANRFEVAIKEHLLRLILQSRANGVPEEVEQEIMSLSGSLQNPAARVRAQFSVLENSDVVISRPSFVAMLGDTKFSRLLHDASIETANTLSLFDVLDADMSGWLSVREVFHGLMRLRGPICKSEIVGIRLRCRHMTQMMHGIDS